MEFRRVRFRFVRNTQGAELDQAVSAIMSWPRHGASTAEIPFFPSRVLMHDTTSTPALVDIAAMRDYVAREGGDPAVLTPSLPVDVSIDHSLRSEEHTSELQSLMRISYAVFCLTKKTKNIIK